MSDEEWQEPKGYIGLLTKADLIGNVAARWREQYPVGRWGGNKESIARRLLAERPQTEDAIEAIIGNRSWTRLACDVCGEDVPAVACLRSPHESRLDICETCAAKAVALFGGKS